MIIIMLLLFIGTGAEATEEPGTEAINKVAIFRTQCYPVFEVLPGYVAFKTNFLCLLIFNDVSLLCSGFVHGQEDEYPVWVGFAGYHGNGSILTTVSRVSEEVVQERHVSSTVFNPQK